MLAVLAVAVAPAAASANPAPAGAVTAAAGAVPVAAGAVANPASANPAPRPDLQRALDAVVAAGATGALAETRDPLGRWAGVSGVAELDSGRPVPVNGRFRIGSVTKTFVSTVILQLVAERRLSLDDPVERRLPGLVPGGDKITVRQLLNHTSGLFNYTEAMPLDGEEFLKIRFRYYSPRQLVAIATAHEPYFPPGTGWHYSNTNYILAGLTIERVTGRPYGAEIQRRILRPLGLRHTSVPGTSTAVPGPHSHGYLQIGSRTVDVTRLKPSWAWAAGEMISTNVDLNRFFAALLGGRLLHPAELAAMKATVPVEPGFGYGLGLYSLDLSCGRTIWGHDGGIHGYVTASMHTADGRRQLTASLNPLADDGLGEAVNNLILVAHCGKAGGAAAMRLPAVAAAF
jgi:D-alanyl-D-alanine carboxypeptidase